MNKNLNDAVVIPEDLFAHIREGLLHFLSDLKGVAVSANSLNLLKSGICAAEVGYIDGARAISVTTKRQNKTRTFRVEDFDGRKVLWQVGYSPQ